MSVLSYSRSYIARQQGSVIAAAEMASRVILETSAQLGSAIAAAASNVLFALCSAPSPEAAQVIQLPYVAVVYILHACLHSGLPVKVGARVHLGLLFFLIMEPNFSRQFLMLKSLYFKLCTSRYFLPFQLTTDDSVPLFMFSD